MLLAVKPSLERDNFPNIYIRRDTQKYHICYAHGVLPCLTYRIYSEH